MGFNSGLKELTWYVLRFLFYMCVRPSLAEQGPEKCAINFEVFYYNFNFVSDVSVTSVEGLCGDYR
jgi:hypothetical protein